jgi:hypothetical protein
MIFITAPRLQFCVLKSADKLEQLNRPKIFSHRPTSVLGIDRLGEPDIQFPSTTISRAGTRPFAGAANFDDSASSGRRCSGESRADRSAAVPIHAN